MYHHDLLSFNYAVYIIRSSTYFSRVNLFSRPSVACYHYFQRLCSFTPSQPPPVLLLGICYKRLSMFIHHMFVQLSCHHVNVIVVYHSLPWGRCSWAQRQVCVMLVQICPKHHRATVPYSFTFLRVKMPLIQYCWVKERKERPSCKLPTRNYGFVLLCVGEQRSRKAWAMCHLLLTPQRLMITIDRQSR